MAEAPRLKDQKVTVIGLAKSGVAAARLCAREGAKVTVTDRSPEAELAEPLAALEGLPVRKVLGGHDEGDFSGADLVVVSPGVPLSIAPIQAARRKGIPVWGEVELAWRFLGDIPVVAITGTNGNSTTTPLAGATGHLGFPDGLAGQLVEGHQHCILGSGSADELVPVNQRGLPIIPRRSASAKIAREASLPENFPGFDL